MLYWSVILATSTAGTTMSDFMDRTLQLGYTRGSLILLGILLAIFTYWRLTEKSMSVANIRTFRVEVLYWIAILFSNTLGTALGDFLADDSGLGFLGGAILIGSLIAAVAAAAYFTKISRVLLFWIAFVLTRPFGATFGDVLTKPVAKGGIGFGTIGHRRCCSVCWHRRSDYAGEIAAASGFGAGVGVSAGVERLCGVTASKSIFHKTTYDCSSAARRARNHFANPGNPQQNDGSWHSLSHQKLLSGRTHGETTLVAFGTAAGRQEDPRQCPKCSPPGLSSG